MNNQDSQLPRIGQPVDPPLKGGHSAPPKETALHKAPPRPAPPNANPKKKGS